MTHETRFQPPVNSPRAVIRHALLAQLQHAGLKRVTTIIAPAGYGKTSVASQWFQVLRDQGLRLSWLSLDQQHEDQTEFLRLLLDAVDFTLPDESAGVESGMAVAALSAILATRLRKISTPVVLFLDDYHFAQNDATEAIIARLVVDRTLDHVKLVLISRTPPRFPVSALRLRGEYKQVNIADLGFSDREAEELFAEQSALLSRDQVVELNKRTEGWAVALQMVRLLIAENVDGNTLLPSFDGSSVEMGSYLSEQVFVNLPKDMQEFLIKTSPFPAFCRSLLEGVFQDSDFVDRIGRVHDYALPIAILGGQSGWVRYHPVFNAFLKEEAARQGLVTPPLLESAARWFQANGDLDSAVRHALMSGKANLAACIVEDSGGWRRVYVTSRGGTNLFNAILNNVALIDLSRFPLTVLGLAVVSAKAGQLEVANHYMEIAERAANVSLATYLPDLRVVRALMALYLDRPVTSDDLAGLEQDLASGVNNELVYRAMALNMLSYNYLERSDMNRALHYGHLAIRAFRDGGADFGAVHLYAHIGQAAYFSGDCAGAIEYYDAIINEVQTHIGKGSDLDALAQVLKAELLAMRGDIVHAGPILAWAMPHLERHDAWFDVLAAGFIGQQTVTLLTGDPVATHALMDRTRPVAKRRGFDRLIRLIDGERACLLAESGDIEQAIRYAQANGFGEDMIHSALDNDFATHLRGTIPGLLWTRIYLVSGDLARARATFEGVLAQQSRKPHVVRAVELALVEIRLLAAEGNLPLVSARLSDLLLNYPLEDYRSTVWIEGETLVALLLECAASSDFSPVLRKRLQAMLEPCRLLRDLPPALPQSGAPDGLTERELAVLQLLSSGFSNKEIGRKLALSDNTIKFHLRNIFTKLNVTTRTAAVTAARSAGLLP
ncbi:LuxR C-terminal-related transcriptional regulator [Rhizobium sp.]|jgi:LuxR family transcriptional regulator, maltose regulon positive regulatory protein|uniref:LuxR C-terminal-related transcriptional regulator n=1 Tax=Rhizobium sp. TaxID=391 RepID=UPI000E8DE74F|nr:transcriptional regulator [Rhizobium sp.]